MKKLCADFLLKRHEKFPRLLSIELTTACNSSCIMCPRPRMKRRIAHMEDTGIGISLADLKKISAGLHNSVEGAAQAAAGISGLA